MALESGMAENPMESYSLQSRLVCCKCWCEPRIVNPQKIESGEILTITVECHGETETKMIEKRNLVQTCRFFEDQAT